LTISGIHKFSIDWTSSPTLLLSESAHLLRRFGSIELIELDQTESGSYRVRKEADEILFATKGIVSIDLFDTRETSPSTSEKEEIELAHAKGQALFIPFEVAYRLRGTEGSQVIRIATHAQSSSVEEQELLNTQVKALLKNHE
jgi:hypothetical protein